MSAAPDRLPREFGRPAERGAPIRPLPRPVPPLRPVPRPPAAPPARRPGVRPGRPGGSAPRVGGATAARRRARRRVVVGGVVLSLFVLAGLSIVVARVRMAEDQAVLARLRPELAQSENKLAARRLEVAELEAPARIIPYAEQHLGMVQPSAVHFLAVDPLPSAGAGRKAGQVSRQAPKGAGDVPSTASSAGPAGTGQNG